MAARSARPAIGDVVTYRKYDDLTGQLLTGAGVVYDVSDAGGITVAPLADTLLLIDPADVAPVAGEQIAPAVSESVTSPQQPADQ